MIVERTTQLHEPTRLARQVSILVAALMIGGVALLAFSSNVHWRLIGALSDGIGIGFFAASKLAVWKA
ncbi:hypothetical protein SAMN03159335_06240 [Burkholderia cepacia]|uniref:hypothetical protein n=1 Tax=Burkholderia cepacia TaxID=292 RepID=UPI0008AE1ACB|nr:hypothetical protein [Burkholderia cepacia]SEU40227.1 hypothetical protein SAMN03159335_06240 [Burkholderia cepacia]